MIPPGVRHVIFDFGGTLADLRWPFSLLRRLFPTATMGPGEVTRPGRVRRLFRRIFYPIVARFFRPYPGLLPTLEELSSAGYRLHILSNNSSILTWQLSSLGIAEIFDTVTWSEEAGVEKPDPRIFEIGLERIGATAAEVVYVGNSFEADVLGARGAGIVPIHADYEGTSPAGSHLKIAALADLPMLLASDPAK